MTQTEEKERLCGQHHDLLYLIFHYGNGAMLTPQLRTLCVSLGLYPSAQAVGRAVRALKAAGVLKRMTWLDGNTDLLICCKFVYRYFGGGLDSQHAASRKRYTTTRQYMAQCCKVDCLIRWVEHERLASLDAVAEYLTAHRCTLFLHLPDLTAYFED